MFRIFKNIFREKRKIGFGELKSIVAGRSHARQRHRDELIKNAFKSIYGLCSDARTALKKLDEAELQNKKIPARALSLMEGNRAAYIRRVELFLQFIERHENVMAQFEDELLKFGKATVKPYHVLQEFFAHESAGVSSVIREISITMDNLVKSLKTDGNALNLAEKINELETHYRRVESLKSSLKALESEKESLQKSISASSGLISGEKEKESYKKLLDERGELEDAVKVRQLKESELHQHFSVLERALKKLSKSSISHQNLISSYIEEPVSALKSDKSLQILQVLSELKEGIGSLDLKDKKIEKTMHEIDFLSSAYLRAFLNEISVIGAKIGELESSMAISESGRKIALLQQEIEVFTARLRACENSIRDIEEELKVSGESAIKREINTLLANETFELE